MLNSVLKRLLWPGHLWRAYKFSKKKEKVSRAAEDPQLKLYDKILQTDFLHYGYFENPEITADKISLSDIRQAQISYAQLIIDQITCSDGTVLDVGCGMGGLISMLLDKGLKTVGVTPDRHQVAYIQNKYPDAHLIKAKFQNMPTKDYQAWFDTIIHSESLQYINIEKAIDKVKALLKPEGRWIVVDYFRVGDAHEQSGHRWENFSKILADNGFKIVYEQEITRNIVPTLSYIYMWGNQIGKPLFEFLKAKLHRKHPAKYYILEDLLSQLDSKIDKNLDTVNPDVFIRDKKYILLSIERS